jgi:hypothetical protein
VREWDLRVEARATFIARRSANTIAD